MSKLYTRDKVIVFVDEKGAICQYHNDCSVIPPWCEVEVFPSDTGTVLVLGNEGLTAIINDWYITGASMDLVSPLMETLSGIKGASGYVVKFDSIKGVMHLLGTADGVVTYGECTNVPLSDRGGNRLNHVINVGLLKGTISCNVSLYSESALTRDRAMILLDEAIEADDKQDTSRIHARPDGFHKVHYRGRTGRWSTHERTSHRHTGSIVAH